MATVKCPECSGKVSATLKACPHCGFVMPSGGARQFLYLFLRCFVAVCVGTALVYWFMPRELIEEFHQEQGMPLKSQPSQVEKAEPVVTPKQYETAEYYFRRGGDYYGSGEYDKAIELYTKVISLASSYKNAYFNRAESHKANGDCAMAIADYNEHLLRSPNDEDARNRLNKCKWEIKAANEALAQKAEQKRIAKEAEQERIAKADREKAQKAEPERLAGAARLFDYLGRNNQGYPEYRHKQTGIVFVSLPGGQFSMGSPGNESGREADERFHRVSLSPFLIAKHEVTQAEWKKIMWKNPSFFPGDAHPVENIDWTETQRFVKASGLMLPTEAQWEYACRAGSSEMFSPSDLNQAGWYDWNSGMKTHPVGQKKPNGFGLYDMHGNVSERCRDVYDAGFYSKRAASAKDPVNLAGRTLRDPKYVIRGGRCAANYLNCRSAHRDNLWFPDAEYPRIDANSFTGFRPVYNLR